MSSLGNGIKKILSQLQNIAQLLNHEASKKIQ
jgi:hypothetical protein